MQILNRLKVQRIGFIAAILCLVGTPCFADCIKDCVPQDWCGAGWPPAGDKDRTKGLDSCGCTCWKIAMPEAECPEHDDCPELEPCPECEECADPEFVKCKVVGKYLYYNFNEKDSISVCLPFEINNTKEDL